MCSESANRAFSKIMFFRFDLSKMSKLPFETDIDNVYFSKTPHKTFIMFIRFRLIQSSLIYDLFQSVFIVTVTKLSKQA